MLLYLLAYSLIAGFFLIEYSVRRGKDTKNMNRTEHDKGSTMIISIVMGAAFILLLVSPLLTWLGIYAIYQPIIRVAGLLLGVGGLIVRYAAFTTLGRFFSRTLREAEDHTLVTNGIYKYIRHPGYLSDFMIFIGVTMAMGSLICIIFIPVAFSFTYAYRIHVEEKMLIEIFGNRYRVYQKTSKLLIPFVF